MATWYYYDENGERLGPIKGREVKQLVREGTITRETMLEDVEGRVIVAGDAPNLPFTGTMQPDVEETYGMVAPPPRPQRSTVELTPPVELPPSVEPSPFTTAPLAGDNPFVGAPVISGNPFAATPPVNQAIPQYVPRPVGTGNAWKIFVNIVKTIALIMFLLVGSAIAWPIYSESKDRSNVSKKTITEKLSYHSLESDNITVNWETKPSTFNVAMTFWFASRQSSASGKFTVKARPKENLYKSVSTEDGLGDLGFTDKDLSEFNDAKKKYLQLPGQYQNKITTTKEPSQFKLYKNIVSVSDNVTLTGSVGLTKSGRETWKPNGVQPDLLKGSPLENHIQESQLPKGTDKIDDKKTQDAVGKIKTFISEVNLVYNDWKFDDAIEKALFAKVNNMSLKIADFVEKPGKNDISTSGKFTVSAIATEKLYQKVDKKDNKEELKKLGIKLYEEEVEKCGITDTYEKEVYECDVFNLYKLLLASDSKITLTGTVELSKPGNGEWKVTKIQVDPTVVDNKVITIQVDLTALDNFVSKSKLPNDACELDEPETKEDISANIKNLIDFLSKLKKQVDDFDKFCRPGAQYEGGFIATGPRGNLTGNARIVFEPPPGANKVKGKIKMWVKGYPNSDIERNFDVAGEHSNKMGIFCFSARIMR